MNVGWVGFVTVVVAAGCSGGTNASSAAQASEAGAGATSDDSDATSTCSTSTALAGASYVIANSKFAFGSAPSVEDAGGLVRYVGSDGVVGILPNGSATGELNAGAAAAGLPDWSSDKQALLTHSIQYWESMGVQMCQVVQAGRAVDDGDFTYGTMLTTELTRAIDGIVVGESIAYARFDSQDQTSEEGFYWPTIPADVVIAAVAFRAQLANPASLTAYKGKLPANSQGPGTIFIHHTASSSDEAFQAVVTYDVLQTSTGMFSGQEASFDAAGNPVTQFW